MPELFRHRFNPAGALGFCWALLICCLCLPMASCSFDTDHSRTPWGRELQKQMDYHEAFIAQLSSVKNIETLRSTKPALISLLIQYEQWGGKVSKSSIVFPAEYEKTEHAMQARKMRLLLNRKLDDINEVPELKQEIKHFMERFRNVGVY